MHWLANTPTAIVLSMLAMLPVLRARESLRERDRIAMGMADCTKGAARELLNEWKREAGVEPRRRKAKRADLSSMGIAMVVRPKAQVTDGGR